MRAYIEGHTNTYKVVEITSICGADIFRGTSNGKIQ